MNPKHQRKREIREREAFALIDDAAAIHSIMNGAGIISKRKAKSQVMCRGLAPQTCKTKDHQRYDGIKVFIPALHHNSACLIKGRTWVKRMPGVYRKDTLHDVS